MIVFSSSKYFEQIYKALTKADFKIDSLVSECPKPAGRGLKICPNPAQIFAEKINLPVITDLKYLPNYKLQTTNYKPFDLGLIFAYGQIIPDKIIEKFKYGILNIHPSLLPKYRGPTPLQTALLNGDQKTGFSIIKICGKCDAGDIIFQEEVEITLEDDCGNLMEKVMKNAIAALPKVCQKYISGESQPVEPRRQESAAPPVLRRAEPSEAHPPSPRLRGDYPVRIHPQTGVWGVLRRRVKQNESEATYTKKLNKSDGLISRNDNAQTTLNKIRAFSIWPKAYLMIDGKKIIFYSGKIENGKLAIGEIQMAGKNRMSFSQFKNGYGELLTKMPDFVKV